MRNESRFFFFYHFHKYQMKILLGDFDAHPDGKTHSKIEHVSMDKR